MLSGRRETHTCRVPHRLGELTMNKYKFLLLKLNREKGGTLAL